VERSSEEGNQVVQTALSRIEECIRWTALYAGMDAEAKFERLPFNQGKDLQ
jgi:hypothetical protein